MNDDDVIVLDGGGPLVEVTRIEVHL